MQEKTTNDLNTESGDANSEAMGRTVGRGGFLLASSSIASRGLSFLVQMVLGYLLSKDDFGVFAIALSVASVAQFLRDGGVPQVLIQRGEKEYPELRGPAFWLALTLNTLAGLTLVAATPLVVRYFGATVSHLLWIIAIWIPLGTPACLYRTRFQMKMQLDRIAQLQIGTIVIRSVSIIALALLGFGPYSFVIPYLITTVFETAFGYYFTREQPWISSPRASAWREMFRATRWLMLSTLASGLNLQGAYLVLGYFLATEIVGVFYFAFLLATQFTILIAYNFYTALFPVLSRLNGQPERQYAALMRSIRAVMLVCSPLSLGVVTVMEPLESLIWHGKWSAAVPCVVALGSMISLRAALFVLFANLQAQGRFRLYGVIELVHAIGLMLVAGVASYAVGTAEGVSWAVGIYMGAAALGLTITLAIRNGGKLAEVLFSICHSWLVSLTIATLCLIVDRFALHGMSDLIRVAIATTLFIGLTWVAMRTILSNDARDLIRVVPTRIGRLFVRVLFMPPIDDAPAQTD